jgi:hypothetical protein
MPDSALTRLPEGYVISENINGQVSVGSIQPGLSTEFVEAQILAGIKNIIFAVIELKQRMTTSRYPNPDSLMSPI